MCIPYSLSPSLWHLHFHFVLSSISWIISIAKVSIVGLLCVSIVSLPLSVGEWLIQISKTTAPFCCNGGHPGGRDTILTHNSPTMDTLAMEIIQLMLDKTK